MRRRVTDDSALDPLAARPKRKSPPYPFVLDALMTLQPEVRPMFSGYAVYLGDKIVMMLRESPKSPEDNGVWLVFSEEADLGAAGLGDARLRAEFPKMRAIGLLGGAIGHWLLLPADSPDFEASALRACEMLLARDARLGRVPKSRQGKRRK